MPITSLPIGNGFYRARSLPVSAQQCMNWYVSIPSAPSLSETQLYGSPGMSQVATSGEGANRGARVMAGIPYFVNGSNLYRLNSDHTLDDLGTISGTGRVSMSDNGTQLCILVPGGAGYIFTEPSTLTAISDLDFTTNGNPQQVTFVDGYFVFTTDAKKFILSAINDGTDYNAIDYGTAESSPDATVTPRVLDVLADRGLTAGFFVVGTQLQQPGAVAQPIEPQDRRQSRARAERHRAGAAETRRQRSDQHRPPRPAPPARTPPAPARGSAASASAATPPAASTRSPTSRGCASVR